VILDMGDPSSMSEAVVSISRDVEVSVLSEWEM
jgi:hypothetical protein